ncbi:hypothetical protein CFSAN001077_17428 [Salmonella enterica subsp. enterica serovar Norwich str. CFSAN001077]|nr:hypothetical protein CFSAN001077_17428 [Salmonella enterica subsp. enterica serovar Norwich str. CFSAN001077]
MLKFMLDTNTCIFT